MASTDIPLFAYEVEESKKEKSPSALRTISEVADIIDVPQHVLRFWETKFSQITPLKRNGGRRFYRPQDIEVLQQIKHLLYKQGYTIKGAAKAVDQFIATRGERAVTSAEWMATVPPASVNDNFVLPFVRDVEEPSLFQEIEQEPLFQQAVVKVESPEGVDVATAEWHVQDVIASVSEYVSDAAYAVANAAPQTTEDALADIALALAEPEPALPTLSIETRSTLATLRDELRSLREVMTPWLSGADVSHA